jgi:hypothetical protein
MLRIGTKRAAFIVVCATYSRSLDERRFSVLHGVFSASNADYWEFVNPASFVSFYLSSDNGAARANELVATLAELKKLMPDYELLGVGRATGDLVARFTWRGVLKAAPRGAAFDEAMKRSSENPTVDLFSTRT